MIRQFWANFTDGATLWRRNAVSWLCGGRWATSTTVSAHGCNVGGSPTASDARAVERLLGAISPSGGAMSWRDSMLFRPARRCCSVFCNTTPKTDFYWDYDDYYLKNTDQEAGMFVRENHASFPPVVELSHDNFRKEKELTVVSTPSNAVQCKYAGRILDALRTGADGRKRPLDRRRPSC